MLRLTRAQVREIDRRAVEEFGIPAVVLMENAARAVTEAACEMLDDNCVGEVLIVCGGGNNGGDGLAVARHLHNRGAEAHIALAADPGKYRGEALVNWNIVRAMKLQAEPATAELIRGSTALLIVDAIFGTGLESAPREPFETLAEAISAKGTPVLAVDVPSGLDADTGNPWGSCVRSTRTVTFVAEKAGFATPAARPWLGEVSVGDIGCPRELIEAVAEQRAAR